MKESIEGVVRSGLCMSCGACAYPGDGHVRLEFDHKKGMFFPTGDFGDDTFRWRICPGKGYPIHGLASSLFPKASNYDVDLGRWVSVCASRAVSAEITKNASSGGVMTAIAHFLISSGKVDGAIVTGMSFGPRGPMPKVYVGTSLEDLIQAQGSKYCPVPALEGLGKILERYRDKRFVFVGTPCHIAALRFLQNEFPEVKARIPFTVGNFCGGFRDFRETHKIVQRQGIAVEDVTQLRYRGGGQPGHMLIESKSGVQCRLPYPNYVKLTGVPKNYRCRVCVDATAELADFACGDAWIPRFLATGEGWSIVMMRSVLAKTVADEMKAAGLLRFKDVTIEEVKASQAGNLGSKKTRQAARRKFYRLIGLSLPEYDGGFPSKVSGIRIEAKVMISHCLFGNAERLGLYPLLAKILRR